MKKLYYFSKSKLQFFEIKHYKTRALAFLGIGVLCIAALIFSAYTILISWLGTDTYSSLIKENQTLQKKLDEIVVRYESMNRELDSLLKVNNELRIAANLEPISEDEQLVGVGGGYFDNQFNGSYCGFVGGSKPQYVIAITTIEPQVGRALYAGTASAQPIFADIAHKLIDNAYVTPRQ